MLIGRVIEHQFSDDTQTTGVGGVEELAKVVERAVAGMDAVVVRDVVAIVAKRRWIHRKQPQAGDAEIREVVELARQPFEVADAVAVAVCKRLDVQLVDDGVLEPQRLRIGCRHWQRRAHAAPPLDAGSLSLNTTTARAASS